MKKINITVNGPIGSGKTTFIQEFSAYAKQKGSETIVQPEPSITIPFINQILNKFYNDNGGWAYPLQLAISAAQEAYMQDLRESDYDISIMDAAWSSSIYGYSHMKNGKISQRDFHMLENSNRDFKFDYLIWIDPGLDQIKRNVLKRNQDVLKGNQRADDLEVDLSYLDLHYQDFQEYKPIYLNKFKSYNPDIKIIEINNIADKFTKGGIKQYNQMIHEIYDRIINYKDNSF